MEDQRALTFKRHPYFMLALLQKEALLPATCPCTFAIICLLTA